jgi:hypothetical protein
MRPEPLHGERRLGLGAVPREPLADQAQLERRDLSAEHAAQQPVLAECPHERPVDLARRPLTRERGERIPRESLRVAQQVGVLRGEVRVRGYAITAVATSSTRAASSNSALTPSRAIAG